MQVAFALSRFFGDALRHLNKSIQFSLRCFSTAYVMQLFVFRAIHFTIYSVCDFTIPKLVTLLTIMLTASFSLLFNVVLAF
ncbi:hypothetical protein BH10BAC3_BH10BAC3_09930 [soil metagenome]